MRIGINPAWARLSNLLKDREASCGLHVLRDVHGQITGAADVRKKDNQRTGQIGVEVERCGTA